TVSGELVFVGTDLDQEVQWVIRQEDGSLTPIALGYKAPETDDLGQSVVPGALVTIPCYIDALGVCNPVPGYSTVVLSAQPLLLPNTERIIQRRLVIIVDYSSCGFPPSYNESVVRSQFLGPNGDGSGGVAKQFTQCSYGRFNVNPAALKVITVKRNCPVEATLKSCAVLLLTNDVDNGAKEMLGNAAFAGFTHKTYILPFGLTMYCSWAGLALLPGTQSWVMSTGYGLERVATIMQEIVHNYGLRHSWRNDWEYADYSTFMGRGDVCLNAPELAYLGWATPAPGGDHIDSEVLPVGTSITFSLPATYLSSNGSYLRVIPDWLPSYNNISSGKNLYISVRVDKDGDALLQPVFANKVNVHELNASLDNNILAQPLVDRKIQFITAIPPVSQSILTTYKVVVYGGSWVGDKDVLRVHLCRYESSPKECPSLNALELLPSPPSPLKPPPASPRRPSSPRPQPIRASPSRSPPP
ncbi:hypothetical protein VOLCADRAFT_41285, partial [Volvox carteri f. nagariensis]